MSDLEKASAGKVPLTAEIGTTGLRRYGGRISEEFIRELQGLRGLRVYREMSQNDSVVGAVLFAIEQLVRSVTWRVEAGGEDPEDEQRAEFIRGALFDDMSSTWQDTVSEIFTMLPFGFSWHEIVYKRRGGDVRDPVRRSAFDDGKIGWRKWSIRAQESLFEWRFDDEGGVQAMIQQDPASAKFFTIPIEKSLLFRTTARKGNPEGVSVLRTAYRPWFFSRRIEENEAIGVERDLAGYPVMQVNREGPDIWNTADPAAVQLKTKIEYLLRSIRRDEQEGMLLPWWVDFKLVSTGSRRTFDTSGIIQRYAQRIACTVLADFILLGHEKVGSFALSSSKTHLFAVALGAYLGHVAGVANRYAIPRLLALNGWPTARPPVLMHGDIETPDLGELGTYVGTLAGAGMPMFPDEKLETALRAAAKLPEPGPEREANLAAGTDMAAAAAEPKPAEPTEARPAPAGDQVEGATDANPTPGGKTTAKKSWPGADLVRDEFVSAMRDLRDNLAKYSEDQERDDSGKWSAGGGGASSASSGGTQARLDAANTAKLDSMYAAAPAADAQLRELAGRVAREVGGKLVVAPVKGRDRSEFKIAAEYDGDASRLKDIVRATIVVPDADIPRVAALLQAQGVFVKVHTPTLENLGYSGVNTFPKLPAGITGEIQVNSPEIIFAKETAANARIVLGVEEYNRIASIVGPGGRGHELYEAHRVLPKGDPKRASIAADSLAYYAQIREKVHVTKLGDRVTVTLDLEEGP